MWRLRRLRRIILLDMVTSLRLGLQLLGELYTSGWDSACRVEASRTNNGGHEERTH